MGVRKGLSRYQCNASVYLCAIKRKRKCVCVCETQPQKQNDSREISMDEWRKKGSCYLSLCSASFLLKIWPQRQTLSPSIVKGSDCSPKEHFDNTKNVNIIFEIRSYICRYVPLICNTWKYMAFWSSYAEPLKNLVKEQVPSSWRLFRKKT